MSKGYIQNGNPDAKLMTENMLKEAQTVIKLHGSEVEDSFNQDLSKLKE
ncbi:MAG: hypothetical protein IPN49_15875 [Saprospiraceae bacterium]|nr:hypothetical protein [Saprospiraceae bacterium]